MNLIALVLISTFIAAIVILATRRMAELLALAGAGVSFLAAAGLLLAALNGTTTQMVLPGLPQMPLLLIATPLTAVLSALVATIAAFVLVYAVGYMRKDPEKPRFFATMLLFVTAMQALVLAGDWITLLAAWELIGFSSYLLIGFWHGRQGVASAATRAFIYTRSADLGLYIGIFVLIAAAGTTEISTTLTTTTGPAATIAGLLLLVAAIGKSAQMPLYDWLQRAMAGPTPVSALLHSATLVAAGAILLIRTAPMLPSDALLVVGLIGGATAIITGLIALSEGDLKRMLAASTSSQYGLMLVAVGAGAPVAALLHLIAHAAIKSSLFLGAGVFQHDRESTAMKDMAGAGRSRPRVFAGFAISALALAGIPPLSGFFSKDAIIASTLGSSSWLWLLPMALAGTVLTGAYMARALRILWSGEARQTKSEGVAWMGAAIGALVVLAIILGAGFPALERLLAAELTTSLLAAALGLSAALGGLALGWYVPMARLLGPLKTWAQSGFEIAGGFDGLVLQPAMAVANACERLERVLYDTVLAIGRLNLSLGWATRQSDEQGIDRMIFGLVRRTIDTGGRARLLQSGFIHKELALTILGTAVIAILLIAAPMYF